MAAWIGCGRYCFSSRFNSFSTRRTSASWSSASMITKLEVTGSRAASRRRMRAQMAWKVPSHTPSAWPPNSPSNRAPISLAALLVKVTAMIENGCTPHERIRCAMRWVSTRVLPEPGPANTSTCCASLVTARRWGAFRSLSRSVDVIGDDYTAQL
jgi:hypothetical protein